MSEQASAIASMAFLLLLFMLMPVVTFGLPAYLIWRWLKHRRKDSDS